ncbi:hypothetical protein PHLCEN_2v8656 [Hermanssonia centrifuga]|uniref:Protein kinase regulator n=1 Tax=Hermanssonia centrifuga TaxID=98765 RepID=A0A2R6NT34_9APHY|nr:hypothetical protein PHLCEN_2v8656 [Hermanssonia centrifuga]
MDGSSVELRSSIQNWDENDVHTWLASLGYSQYENQLREHRVSGEVLCLMDAESLKEVGITTIGQRLAILKAVYQLKLAHHVPIEPDDYVPPSEVDERQEHGNVDRLYTLLRDQGERLRVLEDENRRMSDTLHSCLEDINGLRVSQTQRTNEAESPVNRAPSFKWASFVKSSRSPTKATPETILETPQASPQRAEHDVNVTAPRTSTNTAEKPRSQQSSHTTNSSSSTNAVAGGSSISQQPQQPKPSRQDSSDNLKSFKVSLDDPAWKVLPAALKKYKINNDDWQNYAMFICYGSPGNRIERCLSYDEKPLLLFQKLKDAKKNPVFMLKHIKDIRSPIAVAQQKQAARKASTSETSSVKSPPLTGTSASSHGQGHHSHPSQDRTRPPKLHVNPQLTGVAPALMTAGPNGSSGWPEIMSPAVEKQERSEDFASEASKTQSTLSVGTGSNTAEGSETTGVTSLREIPPSTGVSYAVAIYPYMAEQEDEFDVVVGDTFIILSRARGWWVVQRDPAGSGLIEPDTTKQGWVPAGCLLETSVPVATAIAEATARGTSSTGGVSPPLSPAGSTPILPLSILSTSFPGIALMEYKKKGEEELDLAKDDSLRVFKRYNHWSYAVKEESGDRGWVPSWYIGKVPAPGAPATPSTSGAPQNFSSGTLSLEGDPRFAGDVSGSGQQPQVSPMSSAFPPIQSRTTAVA